MPSVREVSVRAPTLHPGQRRIYEGRSRYNVIRCGRRFGKTEMGVDLATTAIGGALEGFPVGWFAPTYKIFTDAWQRILHVVRPVIAHLDQQGKRVQLLNGGSIEGWSLDTDDPARGRKYRRIIVDEAGMVPNLGAIWRQAIQPTMLDFGVASDAWFFGTPKQIGKDFDDLFDRGGKDPEWRAFRGKTHENHYLPGIVEELRKRRLEMPEWEYLQEYEGEPGISDTSFFPKDMIVQLRRNCLPAIMRGRIDVPINETDRREYLITEGKGTSFKFLIDRDRGPWKLWVGLDPRTNRPSQGRPWVMGVDLGMGVGSSDTVFSIVDASTKSKAAQFVSSNVSPEEAAKLACAAGRWFGGIGGMATICPEANGGQGELFIKTVLSLGYQRLFSQRGARTEHAPGVKKHYGWFSTNPAKEALLTEYRGALADGRYVNLSEESLDQCLGYRYEVSGRTTRLVSDSDAGAGDDMTRMPHGDLVIADALSHYAALYQASVKAQPENHPWDTIGHRLDMEKLEAEKEQEW